MAVMATDAPRPTATELDILRILWDRGPSTVREVHEVIGKDRKIGYTGVLKFLQIMTVKGSVVRNESQRAHVYEPSEPAAVTKRRVAADMLRRVFGGSASDLVQCLLDDDKVPPAEIALIRGLLDTRQMPTR